MIEQHIHMHYINLVNLYSSQVNDKFASTLNIMLFN